MAANLAALMPEPSKAASTSCFLVSGVRTRPRLSCLRISPADNNDAVVVIASRLRHLHYLRQEVLRATLTLKSGPRRRGAPTNCHEVLAAPWREALSFPEGRDGAPPPSDSCGPHTIFREPAICDSEDIDRRYRLIVVGNATFLDNREIGRINIG